MGEHIWLVRNPEGRVIGASVCSADGAISDASFSGKFSKTEFFAFIRAMKHDGLTRSNGYILTREALAPTLPAGQREPLPTGTAGVTVTEDDEKITMTVGPVTEAEAVAALKRHGWAEQAFHFGSFRYRSLVAVQRGTAALTRTAGVTRYDGEPQANGSLCCATLTVHGRDYICGEKADHHGEHISPVSHMKWCDNRHPTGTAGVIEASANLNVLTQKIALEAYEHWGADRDSKVGKLLRALGGETRIRPDLDNARAALAASTRTGDA